MEAGDHAQADRARVRRCGIAPAYACSIQELLSNPNLDDPAQIDAYTLLKCVTRREVAFAYFSCRKDKDA